jgi:hypothetical protein
MGEKEVNEHRVAAQRLRMQFAQVASRHSLFILASTAIQELSTVCKGYQDLTDELLNEKDIPNEQPNGQNPSTPA